MVLSLLRGLVRLLLALAVAGLGTWATLALLLAGSAAGALRQGVAAALALLALACVTAILLRRGELLLLPMGVAALAAVLLWYARIEPSNERDWLADVARAPWAEVTGDRVTVHEVRDFAWRTEQDYTPRWETRTVDLRALQAVDLVASYWMGEAIAHILVSFVFADAPPLAISIETRKARGEPYSTLLGFFRRYELVYVVADERDLIGVRTNVRADPPEQVYLYRTGASPATARRLFLAYVEQMNELRERPAFYNTLTTNCTTQALVNAHLNGVISPLNWKILLSGHVPQLAYEHGQLDRSLPFAELRARSRINAAARAAGLAAPDFSARIRQGLPGIG